MAAPPQAPVVAEKTEELRPGAEPEEPKPEGPKPVEPNREEPKPEEEDPLLKPEAEVFPVLRELRLLPLEVWRALVQIGERLGNSWSSVRIGPVRVISHALWSFVAAAAGTLLTLYVVPVMYTLMRQLVERHGRGEAAQAAHAGAAE